jgi:hypothetical protein
VGSETGGDSVKLEDEIHSWLVSYLASDSELTAMLNGEIAPGTKWDTLPSPYVRFDRLEQLPLVVIGLHRIWMDTLYHVRGVFHWRGGGQPDRSEVNAIGARIDALLHDHEETTATIHVHSFEEEGEPNPEVPEGGDLWLQSGALYRIRASAVV